MLKNNKQLTLLRKSLNSLTDISDEAWSAAESSLQIRNFSEDDHIIIAGDTVSVVHFLLNGIARFYYLDTKGKEYNKSFSSSGQALSSISSLVTGQPSPFYVQALTPVECLTLNYNKLLDLSDRYPEWTSLRIATLEQLVIRKEQREADFLLLSATERYLKFVHDYAHLDNQIPNYHIASYLGVTEVALSRIRKRLGLTPVNEKGSL